MSLSSSRSAVNLEPEYDVTEGIASDESRVQYRFAFGKFLEHVQIEQGQLIQKDPRELHAIIIEYIKYLTTAKGLKAGTIKLRVAVLFHFFDMYDVILNKRKITRFIPEDEDHNEDECYSQEEIKRLLSVSDERIRVAILLMASTGMRIGALSHLQLRDLTRIPKYNLYKIQVYARSKTGGHYTFCTPECAAAIESYIAYRMRFGEQPTQVTELNQAAGTAPLIREQFNITDRLKAKHPKKAKLKTISETIDRTIERAGIDTKGRVRRNHGFRKFAITQMIKASVDYAAREYLVGHRHSRGLDIHYDRTSEEDRLQEYLKAVDLLTINSEHRLERKIKQLETIHSEEWNALKAELYEMRDLLFSKKAS